MLCVLEGTHPPCISREIPRQVAALFPFSQEIPPTSPSTSPALYIFPASSNFSWFPPNSHPPHFNNTPLYYVSCLLKWFLILPFSRDIPLLPNLYFLSPLIFLWFFSKILSKKSSVKAQALIVPIWPLTPLSCQGLRLTFAHLITFRSFWTFLLSACMITDVGDSFSTNGWLTLHQRDCWIGLARSSWVADLVHSLCWFHIRKQI